MQAVAQESADTGQSDQPALQPRQWPVSSEGQQESVTGPADQPGLSNGASEASSGHSTTAANYTQEQAHQYTTSPAHQEPVNAQVGLGQIASLHVTMTCLNGVSCAPGSV